MSVHKPLHVEPRRVRPPFDVPDRQFDQLALSDPDAWRQVRQLDRLTALVEPLTDLEVTPLEERILQWLPRVRCMLSRHREPAVAGARGHPDRGGGMRFPWRSDPQTDPQGGP